jgi:chromosome segregation ATPase
MPTEQLTYAQIAERFSVSTEAARAIVKRHRLPRSRSNDGKTLAAIDLEEIRHKPLPARSPRGHQPVTEAVATLKTRVAELEAELARAEERSRGHRADFHHERERADRMITIQDRLIAELENLRSLLEAAQQSARPVTPRTWREMSWPERWRWLRTTG